MIQRKQTIWLLIAAICAFATYWLPIYKGTLAGGEKLLILPDHFLLFLIVFALGILSAAIIFLFKNRPLQYRLCLLGVILALGALILEYTTAESFKQANTFLTGSYQLGAFLPILIIILLIFAARSIRKDEKLVKSVDRLR
jgi:hypothetical protein